MIVSLSLVKVRLFAIFLGFCLFGILIAVIPSCMSCPAVVVVFVIITWGAVGGVDSRSVLFAGSSSMRRPHQRTIKLDHSTEAVD